MLKIAEIQSIDCGSFKANPEIKKSNNTGYFKIKSNILKIQSITEVKNETSNVMKRVISIRAL